MVDAPNFRVWFQVGMAKGVGLLTASDKEEARKKALELRPGCRVVHVAPYPAEGEVPRGAAPEGFGVPLLEAD